MDLSLLRAALWPGQGHDQPGRDRRKGDGAAKHQHDPQDGGCRRAAWMAQPCDAGWVRKPSSAIQSPSMTCILTSL